MTTVSDKRAGSQTVKEQKALEKNLSLGRTNYANDQDVQDRAKRIVQDCLTETSGKMQSRITRWDEMNEVYHLESLSDSARDFGVHLGTVFAGVEEFATKMAATVFNGRQLIDGTPMDRESGKQAEAAVALVRERFNTDYRLEGRALEFFRDAGLNGVAAAKIVPSSRVVQTYRRPVEARDTDEGTDYKFSPLEKVEVADTRYELIPVMGADFRCPLTAGGIEDAEWCGDFSYPTEQELRDRVKRGWYDKKAVDRLLNPNESGESQSKPKTPLTAQQVFASTTGVGLRDQPDAGAHLAQFAAFEWWGMADIRGNGEVIPCVITMVMKSNGPQASSVGIVPQTGEVVRVTENPYFHQRKPYVAYRPLPRSHEFFTMSIAEVLAANSKYEDDLAVYGLQGAMWEMSPPLEIGADSGVMEEELDNFFPGKPYYADKPGQIGFVVPPARSGIGFQVSEFVSTKAERNMGLGRPDHAPRTPAAGVMTDAQQTDLRQMAWVTAYEQQVLVPLAEMTHGLDAQYMTREMAVRTLGMEGIHAETVTTVRPTDLAVDVRFEAIVGKQLLHQATQVQGLVNLFDRMASVNMMNLQMGRPERYELGKVVEIIMRDGFNIRDMSFLTNAVDVSKLPTPEEEHRAFAMGERPTTHDNENSLGHAMAHLNYFQSGAWEGWEPEDVQAFADHIQQTIADITRKAQQAMPDIDEVLNTMLGKAGIDPSRPGSIGGAAGGAGFATPTAQGGNPGFRSPSNAMGMGQNSGAV